MPQSPEQPTLLSALESLTVDDLKSMLSLFYPLKGQARKSEIIALIAEQYEGDGLEKIWLRLDDLQKAAVAEVVHSGEYRHQADRFAAKYGQRPAASGDRIGTLFGNRRGLSVFNLLFINNYMPADIKARLSDFVPEPAETKLPASDAPPDSERVVYRTYDYEARQSETVEVDVPITILKTDRSALEDVAAMLRLVEAGRIVVSDKTKLPSAAATREIGAMLSGGDYYAPAAGIDEEDCDDAEIGPIKAFAWPMILQAGGLAEISAKKLRLTAAGQKALKAKPADVLRALWKKWLSNTLLDELRRIDVIKGQTGSGQRGLSAPNRRRAVIADAIADCPPGLWVAIDDFDHYMVAMSYDFEVTRDPWSLYVGDPNYGSLGYDGYDIVLGSRYLLCFLFEYAATLGLIDVGYIPPSMAHRDFSDIWGTDDLKFFSRYDGLLYFRVNLLGAYCLGLSPSYAEAPLANSSLLCVLPNHEIVLIGERLPSGDYLLLESYAEKVSDSVWRLDEAKLLSALEAGNDIAKLREFLSQRTGADLPEETDKLLTDMENRGRLLSDRGAARLFECRDKAAAQLIASNKRIQRYCQPAGERHLVVLDGQITAFRRALRDMGYVLPDPALPEARKSPPK